MRFVIDRRTRWSDLRKGVMTGGIGLGLVLFSILDDRSPNSVGLVLLSVGIGFVVLWWLEDRQVAAPGASAQNGRSSPGGDDAPPPPA